MVRIQRFCQILKCPQHMIFFLQINCFHEWTKFWMFLKNWKGIFNISKNTQNQPKNGHAGKAGYSDFAENWKVPKHAFFYSKWFFSWKNKILNVSQELEGYFQHFKKSTKKMATLVRSGYIDFGPNWKVPKTYLVFLQTDCFHERTKFWMFHKNSKGIFNILKNTQNQSKNGQAGKVWIQRFCQKLKTPQNFLFFLQTDCFHERPKFWMFQKNWKGIFNISKNSQNQQKNGHAGKVRLQWFCQKLKSPQNMLFFLQSDCFHERKKFRIFRENWNGIFNISKKTQNQPKNGHAGKVRIKRFCRKIEKSPKYAFSLFKAIVLIKEQNFECFSRIGRVFSTFHKILKINQKMAMPVRCGYGDIGQKIEKYPKHAFFFFKP